MRPALDVAPTNIGQTAAYLRSLAVGILDQANILVDRPAVRERLREDAGRLQALAAALVSVWAPQGAASHLARVHAALNAAGVPGKRSEAAERVDALAARVPAVLPEADRTSDAWDPEVALKVAFGVMPDAIGERLAKAGIPANDTTIAAFLEGHAFRLATEVPTIKVAPWTALQDIADSRRPIPGEDLGLGHDSGDYVVTDIGIAVMSGSSMPLCEAHGWCTDPAACEERGCIKGKG